MCSTAELRAPWKEEAAIGTGHRSCQAGAEAIAQNGLMRHLSIRSMIHSSVNNKDFPLMRQGIALVITTLLLSSLAACNTVKGAGRDIESVGRAGERVIH